MKLIVIVFCLLSERFLIHSISYQRFSWFNDYSQRVIDLIDNKIKCINHWWLLIAIISPLLAVVIFIDLIFQSMLFGFTGLMLSLLIFYYCLGPQNVFYPLVNQTENTACLEQTSYYFSQVNGQLFALLFWFLLGGPLAALAYRLITLCCGVAKVSVLANQVTHWLEWIPARITVLLFLLAGNFQKGFNHFLKSFFREAAANNAVISECGLLALASDHDEATLLPAAEQLVEYSVIILLVFIALFTLQTWI